jgi:hypothetical protein
VTTTPPWFRPGDQPVAAGAREPIARLVSKPGANSTVEASDVDQSVKSRIRSRLASYQGESRILDSPEGVCAGQTRVEYPSTSVPFSNVTCWHQPAYVSPQRQPHSSPHSCRPAQHLAKRCSPARTGRGALPPLQLHPDGNLRRQASSTRRRRMPNRPGVAAAAGEGGRSLSITSTRAAGNPGTARPSSRASQAGIERT